MRGGGVCWYTCAEVKQDIINIRGVARTHARTHAHRHTRTHARARTRTHTHTHTPAHARARAHARTHARTRAHTHTHTRKHTYTYTHARTQHFLNVLISCLGRLSVLVCRSALRMKTDETAKRCTICTHCQSWHKTSLG